MRTSLPTSMGRNRLSTRPITSTPQATRARPCHQSPATRKYAATGTQTSAAPTAGSSDRKAISTAQSRAPVMPRNQNAMPPSRPWIAATSRLPLTVARTTVPNRSSRACLWGSVSGRARRNACTIRSPSRIRKKARYSATHRLARNSKVFCPMPTACPAMTWLPCASDAVSRRCTVSKSRRPSARRAARTQRGRASKRPCR